MTAAATAADRLRRSLVTPEGVDLELVLASAGERMAAFLIDAVIIVAVLVGLTLALVALAIGLSGLSIALIVWLLGFFLLRNFYFASFELRRRAATPGKRALGLRVVSQRGGRLTADAVLVRNLMREIEVFLPLTLHFLPGSGVDALLAAIGLLWTGTFTLFLLFNRDRMRVGDLLAGTWVVHVPRPLLLPDIAGAGAERRFAFSRAQVDVYGIRELQMLEQVLRTRDPATMTAVAERIRRKIAWTEPGEDAAFLDAFYAALRDRLESRLLFGHRRRDKFDTP